jgi:hypothetical protein
MRVDWADRSALVEWTVTECAFLPDRVGTRPTFTITPVEGDGSELHFRHHGLITELECIEMCTPGRNTCLASLRQYVESARVPRSAVRAAGAGPAGHRARYGPDFALGAC